MLKFRFFPILLIIFPIFCSKLDNLTLWKSQLSHELYPPPEAMPQLLIKGTLIKTFDSCHTINLDFFCLHQIQI